MTPRGTTLAYAISCWGVLDPHGRYLMAQERGNESLMANHERYFLNPETMQEANLIRILQEGDPVELPPALLILDSRYGRCRSAAGGDVELALFEGMPHGIAGWPDADVAKMIEQMKSFIAQCLASAMTAG